LNKTPLLSTLVLCALPVLLLLGCAPKPRLAPDERTPEKVLGCALDNQMEYQTLACLMKLKLVGQKEKSSGTMEFFFRSPDAFSFHPRTLFGMGGFRARGEGDSLTIYFPKENEFYRGSLSNFGETALWSWKIPLRMVLETVLGRSGLSDARVSYAGREEGFFLYELQDEDWSRRYWVDPGRCRLTKSRWTSKDGGEVFSVKYEDFRREDQKEAPRAVTITSGSGDSVTLGFLERRWDRPVPEGKFDLQIPSDARQIKFEPRSKE
jgi:outer membrane lipoprotein-sorting protein